MSSLPVLSKQHTLAANAMHLLLSPWLDDIALASTHDRSELTDLLRPLFLSLSLLSLSLSLSLIPLSHPLIKVSSSVYGMNLGQASALQQ